MQGIGRVSEKVALLPPIALAIDLLALLFHHPLAPVTRLLLFGVAATACWALLIRSALSRRWQVFSSALCILVSTLCICAGVLAIPAAGTRSPDLRDGWGVFGTAHRRAVLNAAKLDSAIVREVGKRQVLDPQFAASRVPEPATWLVLTFGTVALFGCRRLRRH